MAARVAVAVMVLACVAGFVAAEHSFEAHRLAQFDVGDQPRGSRSAAVDLKAAYVDPATAETGSKLNRFVVVVKLVEATKEYLEAVLTKRRAGGLLLLLPAHDAAIPDDQLAAFHEVEEALLALTTPVPVYFSYLDDRLEDMYAQLRAAGDTQGSDSFQITAVAPSKMMSLGDHTITNVQAWLPGSADTDGQEDASIIAVVAHYDSFSPAPTMANGADSNGSGASALLEVARLFSQLYNDDRTRGTHSLLFVLTGAGAFDFSGSSEWFAALDDNTADALAFVVCVDSIGSGDGLYLHTSKKRTSVVAAPFFAAFERAAEVVGVDLVFNRKKVNLAAAPAWEHEVFARERIPALTVSALAQERPNMQRARLFDDSARLSSKAVLRNTKVLAEAIGAMIYGEEKLPLFEGSLSVDANHLRAWEKTFATEPRAPNAVSVAHVVDALHAELKAAATEAKRQKFILSADKYELFVAVTQEVTVYTTKPITFDVYLLIAVSLYCFALAIAVQGKDAFKGLL